MAAVASARSGDASALATAIRYTLQLMAEKSPGYSVEVRIPPYAAIQCVAGPVHRRGTPANVVECPPELWLELCLGTTTWSEAKSSGKLLSSGTRADEVQPLLPLFN